MGAAFQDVRKEAISALRAIKPEWSVGVPVLLEKKLDTEPDENVKKRIRRLLGLSSGNGKKEQRYVDINDVAAKPKDADRLLLETTIAGAFYRDMSVVEGQLSSGDILYLKPEPDNKYDNNAILVTAEDGYVLGYIPRDENTPLVNRINNGEKLYGILCDEIEHYGGRPFIEIWISSNVESSGTNIIPFSLYQNRKL